MQIPVLEIHSRKSQPARVKAAEAFRKARQAIMFTSDVSARGVDYPDVSLVIQVCPSQIWTFSFLALGLPCRQAWPCGKNILNVSDTCAIGPADVVHEHLI